jgi:hypothetical protein
VGLQAGADQFVVAGFFQRLENFVANRAERGPIRAGFLVARIAGFAGIAKNFRRGREQS